MVSSSYVKLYVSNFSCEQQGAEFSLQYSLGSQQAGVCEIFDEDHCHVPLCQLFKPGLHPRVSFRNTRSVAGFIHKIVQCAIKPCRKIVVGSPLGAAKYFPVPHVAVKKDWEPLRPVIYFGPVNRSKFINKIRFKIHISCGVCLLLKQYIQLLPIGPAIKFQNRVQCTSRNVRLLAQNILFCDLQLVKGRLTFV